VLDAVLRVLLPEAVHRDLERTSRALIGHQEALPKECVTGTDPLYPGAG
jgi:hypothetical protein